MWRTSTVVVLVTLVVAAAEALMSQGRAEEAGSPPQVKEAIELFERLAKAEKAEIVFTATLTEVSEGPTALSLPPIRSYLLEFTGVNAARGTVPAKARGWYSVRSKNPPVFKVGQVCTVIARMAGGELRIDHLSPGPIMPAYEEVGPLLPQLPPAGKDDAERRKLQQIWQAIERSQAARPK